MNPPRQSVLILIVADLSPRSSRYNYVSNLPADATLKMLAATIKARWICEQAHQQLKEALGFDHFERPPRVGLHRNEDPKNVGRGNRGIVRVRYGGWTNTKHKKQQE